MTKPIIFQVTIAYKKDERIKYEDTSVSMEHCPRVGDVINTDGCYKKVVLVSYDVQQPTIVTVFVNNIGDEVSYEKFIMSKIENISSSPELIDWL